MDIVNHEKNNKCIIFAMPACEQTHSNHEETLNVLTILVYTHIIHIYGRSAQKFRKKRRNKRTSEMESDVRRKKEQRGKLWHLYKTVDENLFVFSMCAQ